VIVPRTPTHWFPSTSRSRRSAASRPSIRSNTVGARPTVSERSVPVHAVAAIPAGEEAIRSAFDEIYVEPPFCEWIEDCCEESVVPDFGPAEPLSLDVAHTGGES